MKHVILGAGPAGVTAAETLRASDPHADITLVSGEPGPPYSRMAIPYVLRGMIEESGTQLRPDPGHYDRLGIDVREGQATGLDAVRKRVLLAGGEGLAYDKLLIATGASAIVPPIEGAQLPGVHPCWTLADARAIAELCRPGARVVLIGAGFIGSILLEALHARGAELTVVEIGPRMVPRMLDETAGGMLQRWCEAKGVRVLTGARVERISRAANGGPALRCTLSGGTELPAQLVVLAAGVRPNVDFLVASGMAMDGGIRVDQFLRSSVPDVYAAGDCAAARDLSTGAHGLLAIQPTAVEHGRIAALNMAGRPTPHRGSLNMNVLDTLGLVSSSFGLWQGAPGGSQAIAVDERGWRYLRLEFADDRLVGAQAVGLTDHIGLLRGLIQTGLRLGAWSERLMRAPERIAEAYIAVAHGMPAGGPSAPAVKVPA